MKPSSARALLGLALVVYVLWVGALITMAVLSAGRPADHPRHRTVALPARPDAGRRVGD